MEYWYPGPGYEVPNAHKSSSANQPTPLRGRRPTLATSLPSIRSLRRHLSSSSSNATVVKSHMSVTAKASKSGNSKEKKQRNSSVTSKKSWSLVQSTTSLVSAVFNPNRSPSRSSLKSSYSLRGTARSKISVAGINKKKESKKDSRSWRSMHHKKNPALATKVSEQRHRAWKKRNKHIKLVDGKVVSRSFGDVIKTKSSTSRDSKDSHRQSSPRL